MNAHLLDRHPGAAAPGSRPAEADDPCGCLVYRHPPAEVQPTRRCTNDCTNRFSVFGVSGGAGATTVAAVLSLTGSALVPTLLQSSDLGQVAGVLGLDSHADTTAEVLPGLTIGHGRPGRVGLVVADAGHADAQTAALPGARRIGVLRGPCYLALRRLASMDHGLDGLVMLAEQGRVLNERDVADVTGLDVVATVPVTPAVARAIDAGILPARLPRLREFARLSRWFIAELEPFPTRLPTSHAAAPPTLEMPGTDLLLPPYGIERRRPDRVTLSISVPIERPRTLARNEEVASASCDAEHSRADNEAHGHGRT